MFGDLNKMMGQMGQMAQNMAKGMNQAFKGLGELSKIAFLTSGSWHKIPNKKVAWTGWSEFNNQRNPFKIDHMIFDFKGGITGEGNDYLGKFTLKGQLLPNGSVTFERQYTSQNVVKHQGAINGDVVSGQWLMPNGQQGNFQIQPLSQLFQGKRQVGFEMDLTMSKATDFQWKLNIDPNGVFGLGYDNFGFYIIRGTFEQAKNSNKQAYNIVQQYFGKNKVYYQGNLNEWNGKPVHNGNWRTEDKKTEGFFQIMTDQPNPVWTPPPKQMTQPVNTQAQMQMNQQMGQMGQPQGNQGMGININITGMGMNPNPQQQQQMGGPQMGQMGGPQMGQMGGPGMNPPFGQGMQINMQMTGGNPQVYGAQMSGPSNNLPDQMFSGGSPFEGKRIDELMAKIGNSSITATQFKIFMDNLNHKSNKMTWFDKAGPRVHYCTGDWLQSLVNSLTFKDEKLRAVEVFASKMDMGTSYQQKEEIAKSLTFNSDVAKAKVFLGI